MSASFPFSSTELQEHFGASLILESFVAQDTAALWLDRAATGKWLALVGRPDDPLLACFHGEHSDFRSGYILKLCPTDHENGRALRAALPWLQPSLLGLNTSAGFGDRLGLATPGHVRALQRVLRDAPGNAIAPIFAQQSIREMERSGRTPDDVLNDATWGAFQAGWRGGLGADADHLKTPADIDICAAAGFSFYTIDPGAYVDSEVDTAVPELVRQKVNTLPWQDLESSQADTERRYAGQRIGLEDREIVLDESALLRAAAKYGRAIAHVAAMYRHLAAKGIPFELEVSVDETETPTTHAEHVYIAGELKRLGVHWVSLAPRYIGSFEKGVDYIGDLAALRADLAGHAAIARALGPYKLSLHSGSDKFSVYPLITEAARGMVHLKTAGTSYLEALRVLAQAEPKLFREILAFARVYYEQDRATYHVSAELGRVPPPAGLPDARLPELLEDFDARQVLHVTFGSTLARFGTQLRATLHAHEADYDATLERHFVRHLEPFARSTTA
ncbi:MAG: tagaturonate epimerase family protein [Roseiflexaceae bacterium]